MVVESVLDKVAPDSEQDTVAPETEPETEAGAGEVQAQPEAELSTEGEVPAVAESPEQAAADVGQTASEQAFGDKPTAQSGSLDGGMFEPEEYQAACQAAGTPDKWQDQYARGHTNANGWVQPYEGRYDFAFELKNRTSASQALKDFVAGPTIADFRAIAVAVELDELRDDLGDQRFDQMFGSTDGEVDSKISGAQRLKITSAMFTTPFAEQMLALAAENEAADSKTDEPDAPAVEARVEEKPEEAGVTAQPEPAMIADELGMQQEQEFA